MAPPPRDLLVRWVTRWDKPAVLPLLAALAAQHGVTTQEDVLREAFEHALRNPDAVRFCIAERDRQVIAVASLHGAYSTWSARAYGLVEDVFVLEEARRSGVARALFDFLVEQARRRGYCRLDLAVQSDNAPALGFYQSYGFADTGYLVYRLDLAEEAT